MRVVSWNVNGIRACVRHGIRAPCDHPQLVVDALDRAVGHPGVEIGEDPRRVLPDRPRQLDERRQA